MAPAVSTLPACAGPRRDGPRSARPPGCRRCPTHSSALSRYAVGVPRPQPGHPHPVYLPWYLVATAAANGWPLARACSTVILAALAELMSCDTLVPRSVNSGMSTNWIPMVGRGCTPGFFGSAELIEVWVCL